MVVRVCLLGLVSAACLEAPPGAPADEADASSVISVPDGGRTDAAPFVNRSTCATIHEDSPEEGDGRQVIDPDGEDGEASPFEVYCDMTIDGGGWMMVARSVGPAVIVDFGWLYDTGLVTDLGEPYSLSVNRPGLTFTEMLVGSRAEQREWGDNVYRIGLPEGFVTDYEGSAVAADPVTVIGDCEPGGGPAMLHFVGHVDGVGHFFLRDMSGDVNFGFFPSGFQLSATACATSGALHGQHGMIFVR
ncbi:MAG TPA: fibrinogen-like YCDxxxxGGGW domain-containing protein [Kofleriaceae bacterium]|nr:fibrinogen-like YCDxxxxGGGW domain-containing protein [Kofleriaceae bacterium]